MKKILSTLSLLVAVLCVTPSMASHIVAGDLTFTQTGPHIYRITLNLYRDCNGRVLSDTAVVNYSSATCGVSNTLTLRLDSPVVNVTDTCPGHNSACNGGTGYGIERHTYTGLVNLPSGCGADWIFSFRNCARNAAITTIVNPGNTCFYIQAALNNTLSAPDHSPTFLKDPVAFTCLGQLAQLNQAGSDIDGDSLVYSLVASQSAAGTPVNYLANYSATHPLTINGSLGFSSTTGQLSFTPDSFLQVGVLKILVSEYRNGVLIGTIERDMQVIVQNCSDSLPQVSGITGTTQPHTSSQIVIPACTTGCFDINTFSNNPDTSVHLTVSITGQSSFPGATFTTSSGNRPVLTTCWTPTRGDAYAGNGVHTLTVTVKDNACPNPGQSVVTYTVIVPQVSPAGPDTSICQYNVARTNAQGTGTWTIASFNPATTYLADSSSPTTLITGFSLPGRYNYVWTGTGAACQDTMSVVVTAKPNAGVDKTICQNSTATMTASGTGRWTKLGANAALTTITDTTLRSTNITGFSSLGTYTYVWTSNGCTDTVNVFVTTKPNAGPDQTICASTGSVVMAATGSGSWTASSGNPAATSIASSSSPTTSISGLTTPGIYTYIWGVGCTDSVNITVLAVPVAGADQTICQYSTTIMGATGTGTWSQSSGPTSVSFGTSSSPTSSVSGFTSPGVYGLVWSNGTICTDTVYITVTPKPNAGPDITICQNATATMAATGTGTWTKALGNTATITNPSSATSTITGLTIVGTYTFYWTTNSCSDTMNIIVNQQPNAGPDQTICQYNTAKMAGTGAGTWTAQGSNPATINILNPTSDTTTITGFSVPGIYIIDFLGASGCNDTFSITVIAKPNAGLDQTVCQNSTATMAATGTGTWTKASGNTATITNATSPTSTITGLSTVGTYTFYWTSNGCSDTMNIIVNTQPNAGPDQTICRYNTVTMAATGTGTWSALSTNSAPTVITANTSPTTTITGFTVVGTYNYVWTLGACTDTVKITVQAKPNAGIDKTVCQYSSTTMAATGTGTWTLAPGNTATVVSPTSPTSTVTGFNTVGTYTFYWSSNGCSDTMNINVNAKPNAGIDVSVCTSVDTVVMAASGTGVWTASASNVLPTQITTPGSPTTSIRGFNNTGTYAYIWTSNGCTDTAIVTSVNCSLITGGYCPDVIAGTVSGPGDTTLNCHASSCVKLKARYNDFGTTSTYRVDTIPYNPFPLAGGTPISVAIDDVWSDSLKIPFPFCYFGNSYHKLWIGSNSIVTFNYPGPPNVTGSCPWAITSGATIPNPAFPYLNSIMFPYEDKNPAVTGRPNEGLINYQVIDTYPCRKFVITFDSIPEFQCDSLLSTCQLVLYETTNVIEMYIGHKPLCSWNNGWAIQGIENSTGSLAYAIPGRNNGVQWTAWRDARRFTPSGPSQVQINWYQGNTLIGTHDTVTVCVPKDSLVSKTTTYKVKALYLRCAGDTVVETDSMHVITQPTPPSAGPDQNVCISSGTAIMAAAHTGTWLSLATNPSGTSFSNNTSPTATVTGLNAVGTYQYLWGNGCYDTMAITVIAKPNAGPDQTTCQFSSVKMLSTGIGTWSQLGVIPAVANIVAPSSDTSLVTGFTLAGTYSFIWTSNGCTDTMNVFVTPKPNAGADQTICQYTTATMAAAGSGHWTASSLPSVVTFANDTVRNTIVSGFIDSGTYTLYWTSNGCSDTVLIHVTAKPNAGPDQTICQYTTTRLHSTGTGVWSVMSGNPAVTTIVTASSDTTLVRGFTAPGTYHYIWSSGGCTDTMNVFVTAKPNAGPDQIVCQFTPVVMGAVGTGTWSAISGSPHATTFVNANYDSTVVNGFTVPGSYSFVWTSNGCTDTVKITVISLPNAGADQTICQYSTATMAATGQGRWTASLSNPSITSFSNDTVATTSVNGFTSSGSYTFYWGANGCTDTMIIHVTAKPNAGPDVSTCYPGTATTAAGGSGTWSVWTGNPGSSSISPLGSPVATVSGFSGGGTYSYIWTANSCSDTMNVLVVPLNSAGPDQTICQFTTATMASVGPGTWTILSGNPASTVIVNPSSDSSLVTGFTAPGIYTYVWNSGICTDTMLINVTAKPNAGADQTICQYTSTAMTATGSGTWSQSISNPIAVNFVNNNLATSAVSGFVDSGDYVFYWTNAGCSDTMLIHVTAKPNAGPDQTICQFTTTKMNSVGSGSWSQLSTDPAVTNIFNVSSDTTTISGFVLAGSYHFVWTANGCTDTVVVNVTAKPNAGPDQTICQYTAVVMGAAQGVGTWTASPANPHVTTFVSANYDSTGVSGFIVAGTYTYTWTSNGCTDTMKVFVTPKPNAGIDQTICQYTGTVMAATGSGRWTASALPSVVTFSNDTLRNTSVSGFIDSGTYTLYWTKNGCADTVLIHVTAKPNAGSDQTICQYTTTRLQSTGVGVWSQLSGGPATATIVTPSSDTTLVRGFTVAGTYSFIWTSNGCTDTMNVYVTAKPNAGPDQTICQYTGTTMAATGSGTWTASGSPSALSFANDTVNNTSVSGFVDSGTYTLYWTSNGCTDTVQVHVTAKPNAGSDQTICQYTSTRLQSTGVGIWSQMSGGPTTATIVTPSSDTTIVRGFTAPGTYSFIWTSNGCTDTMNVSVTAKPNAGADQTICQYSTVSMAAQGMGTWTALSNPAVTTFANQNYDSTVITGFNLPGKYSYVWTSNGCTDTVNVFVTPKPNAGNDQTICQFSTTAMTATGSGHWTADAGNPAVVAFATDTISTTTVSGFTSPGVYTIYWSHTGCTDTVLINVTSKPDAGTDQSLCLPGTITTDATGAGAWTALSTNPAATTIADTTLPVTSISGFTVGGIYSYVWTVNGCSDTVSMNIIPLSPAGPDQTICQHDHIRMSSFGLGTWTSLPTNPLVVSIASANSDTTLVTGFDTAGTYGFVWNTVNSCTDTMYVYVISKPQAGPDQIICQYSGTSMGATGSGTWTQASNPAVVSFADTSLATSTVNGFTVTGAYTFYWSLNGCQDTMVINVTAKPIAGADQTICQYSNIVMAATGRGLWSADLSNPALASIGNDTAANTAVTGFTAAGAYTFYWSLNGCQDTVLINVTPKPDAGIDTVICQHSTLNMSATGTGVWTQALSNPAPVRFIDSSYANTFVYGFDSAGTYTFYWSLNGCSDTMNILVKPVPVVGSDQTICQYSSITTFAVGHGVWTPNIDNNSLLTFGNDTMPVTTVTGFTVPSNYVITWTVNGCSSNVNINVISKPNAGVDQSLCLPGTITMAAGGGSPGLWTAISTNPATTSFSNNTDSFTVVSGFTTGGYYNYIWTVGGCSDTMSAYIIPLSPAGSDQTICQYTTATTSAFGLGTWTSLTTNPAVTSFVNDTMATTVISGFTVSGTYGYIWTTNVLCADTMYIFVTAKPNAGTDQTLCQYSSTTMTATGTGAWTQASNPAVVTFADTSLSTSDVTGFTAPGAYTFYWSLNGCQDTVVINVTPKPNAGPDQTICQYSGTAMAATGMGLWTQEAGNPIAVTFAYDTAATSAVTGFVDSGNYVFYWSLNGCIDTMMIHVTAKPNAGIDQTICQFSSVTMTGTGTGVWTLGTNPLSIPFINFVSGTSPTSDASGFITPGVYNFYWTNNGCSDTVVINVTAKPNAGPDQTICQYSGTAMAATGMGLWTQDAGNPIAVTFAFDTAANSAVTGFVDSGNYIFYWSLNGCTDTMMIHVTAKPNAGTDQTFCQYSSTTMTATGTGAWTQAINPAVVTFADTSLPTSVVTGFTAPGAYTFYWSLNGCQDTVVINVTAKPNAGPDQTICQYSGTAMAATGMGLWSQDAGNPIAVTFAYDTAANSAVTGFVDSGNYIFYWSLNGCTDTMLIHVTAKPNAGTDQTLCQYSSTAMNATGTGTWSEAGGPALVSFGTSSSPLSTVSGFTAPGVYTLLWTLNGCSDTVLINVTAKPNAGTDQTICQYSATAMTATGLGLWTQDAGNPMTLTFAYDTAANSAITGFDSAGTYTFYWSYNGCKDTMLIHVTAKPNAGTDQTICQYSITAMNATGTGAWSEAGGPVVVSFATTSSPVSSVSGFTAPGVYTLLWTLNGCSDTVLINVTAKPNAGSDQNICQYNTITMTATGSGTWTQEITNPVTVSFGSNTSPTSSVTGFTQGGIYAFYWTYNGCSDTVLIHVTAKPDAGPDQTICQNTNATMSGSGSGTWSASTGNPAVVSFALATSPTSSVSGFTQPGTYILYFTQNGCSDTAIVYVANSSTLSVLGRGGICPGQNDTLTAITSVAGGVYSWSPGTYNTQSIVVSPTTTTTFTVTYTIPVCGSYTDTATVTVYPPLTLSRVNDTICIGSSATLVAIPSTPGGVYSWSPVSSSASSITVTPTAQTVYTVTYSLKGCPTVTSDDTVTVTIPPTLSLTGTSICVGNNATLTAVPSQPGGVFSWAPGGGNTASIVVSPSTTTLYTVQYAIPGSVCPPTVDTATVFVTPQPALTVTNDTICFGQNATLTATPNIGGGIFVWTPTGYSTASITVSPPVTSTYNVTYTVPNCGVANGSGRVVVNQNPTLSLDSQNITCFGYTNGIVIPTVNPASGKYSYNWSNGTHSRVDSNLAAGAYSLTVTDQNTCTATAGPINVVEPPQAFVESMPHDTTVLQGDTIQLSSVFSGYPQSAITGYSWTPSDGLSCNNCPNPILNTTTLTDSVMDYTITVLYNNGCHVSVTDIVRTVTGVTNPNAFTPNGDGHNDFFTLITRGVKTFHMSIYNRWGQLVYESTDPAAGWDGTYKGEPQPAEDYIFYVSITNLNGSTYNKQGTVTILR